MGQLQGYNLNTVKFYKLGFSKFYKVFNKKKSAFQRHRYFIVSPTPQDSHENKTLNTEKEEKSNERRKESNERKKRKTGSQYLIYFWTLFLVLEP